VKFAIQELALELVTIIEFDAPMAILEVIMELSLVNILSYLHQSSFSFELVIGKASLILFLAIDGDVLSRYELILFKNSSVDCPILLVGTLPASYIIIPGSFIKTALRPLHATLSESHSILGFTNVYLSCSIFDANFVSRKWLDVRSVWLGILFGIGDGDVNGRASGCCESFILRFLLKGLTLFANLCISH
jgi:hypothetical protein